MQELRLAVRALRATPIVSLVAVLSLALGIGANTAIFSLIDGLLLRTLPVAEPQRLVAVSSGAESTPRTFGSATLEQFRRQTHLFDGALAYSPCCAKVTLTVGGETATVDRYFVSGDFFETLGVRPLLGRVFSPADDVPDGGSNGLTAVISYGLWQRSFGGAVAVIGQRVSFDHVPVTIVGVTPPDFVGVEVGRSFEVAFPVKTEPQVQPSIPIDADAAWLRIMLRLKPGLSPEAATTALRAVQPQIRAAAMPQLRAGENQRFRPTEFLKDPFTLVPAGTGTSALRQRFQRPLATMLVIVALVLMIAAANVANLLLARGIARQHELSVRLALGASRWRLVRPLLMESVVLATIGAVLGLAFAAWASRVVVAQLSISRTPVSLNLSLDWRVLTFTLTALVVTTILFGVVPALRATHVALMDAMKTHGRGAAAETRGTLSGGLVVAQIALSVVLVVAAGLFVRTFERLAHVSLGFDRDRVLVVTVTAPTIPAPDRNAAYHGLVKALAAVPGVERAGGSMWQPLVGVPSDSMVVTAPGVEPDPDAERIAYNLVTPGWLGAYGTPIQIGRDFDDHDTNTTRPVMLVNETLARRLSRGRDLVGTTWAVAAREPGFGDVPLGAMTVIGVVGDTVYGSVRQSPPAAIYLPLAQSAQPLLQTYFYIGVRSAAGPPTLLTRGVATALTAVNRDLLLQFRPLADQVDSTVAQDRLVALLSGFFGGLALLLAALGLYGVTAYAVARRRAEIGIRMALGAAPARVVRLVLSRVSALVAAGVVIGAGVSLWASAFVASLLYGLEPRDPATLVDAALILAAVGTLASGLPAWRASRIDPAEVLRGS